MGDAPGPLFVTVIVKPMSSPAFTVPSSASLVISRSGHSTVTLASSESVPLFVESTVPVLSISAHEAAVVGDVMCTVTESPGCSVPKSHVSSPLAIAQSAAPVPPSIDQFRPPLAGSVSESVTPCARPVPVFETVRVKPMSSPAETVALSAVLSISTLPGFSVLVKTHVIVSPDWALNVAVEPESSSSARSCRPSR